jgi:hypothetical protein
MIDKRIASAQVDRLAGLNWYPRDGVAQIELILAVEASENEFIAAYVIDQWIRYQTEAPKPAALRSLVWAENEKLAAQREETRQEALSRRGVACPSCHDFGIVESIHSAPIESVASYCDCRSGHQRKGRIQFDECNPDAVNVARAKLLKLTGAKAALVAMYRRTEPTRIFADNYRGEF